MLSRKINVVPVKINQGFTLVEMLISLFLGTVILFSLGRIYSDFVINNQKQSIKQNLQKDAHQIIDYLKQHISHIHYQGYQRTDSNYLLFTLKSKQYTLDDQCAIFFYDVNGDGCIGNRNKKQSCVIGELNNTKDTLKEIFGIKLQNKELYGYAENLDKCTLAKCQELLSSCNKGLWKKFTDAENYSVEKLEFKWKQVNQLIMVELVLKSKKDPSVEYQANFYSYLFNGKSNEKTP